MPGFRKPTVIATDYEVAVGLERYELLKNLRGEDPWEDLHPIQITKLGTVKDPIIVRGIDDERYIGCTGEVFDSNLG
jgi:cytochrome c oxidase subunit 5b